MTGDLKRRHERAVSDALLQALGIDAAFLRPGDDQGEPDMIYMVRNAETLGIEVATAYYSDDEARADWTLARGDRPFPPEGVEVRKGMWSPDDLICDRVQAELIDKCAKRYTGADRVWLCIHQEAPLNDRASVTECVQRLRVPTTHGFETIYLTYTAPMHEGGNREVVALFGGSAS